MYNPLVYNIETIRNIINQIYPDNNNDIETLQNILNDLQKQINELKKD
jgi:hypothetical protein